jgi:signal transduction histidine kinase
MRPIAERDAATEELRILVAEDDRDNLVAIEAALEGLGTVVRATSGADALRRLLVEDAAVLLLDVHLGDMDGHEAARLVRRRERHRDMPIIFLTASDPTDQQVLRGYDAGAIDYVLKPVQAHVLRAKVGAFVQMSRHRRMLEQEIARRRHAEGEVLAMARGLETRIAERTRELEIANADLRNQMEVNVLLRRQLESASRRKDEFLAVLGHELRSPLAAIANATSALETCAPGDPVAGDMRSIVSRQVGRLSRLVGDLLDIARITRGTIDLRLAVVDMRDVVRCSLEAVSPLLEARGHVVDVNLPDAPVQVRGDAVRLEQVVTNLLDNAAKYTPEHGRIWVSVESREDSRPRALLSVRDDGPGVAAPVRSQVFDLFTRGPNALEGRVTGFGVGLALCRQLVELHGGSIGLDSGVEGGSNFVLEMPLARPSAAVAMALDEEVVQHDDVASRRVLIIEDNADAAASLALMLRAQGGSAEIAGDGEEALLAIDRMPPDLVLLDIGLPGLDGHSVAKRIRERLGSAVHVIALTGFAHEEARRRALEAGCNAHLTKPITPQQLRAVLHGQLP